MKKALGFAIVIVLLLAPFWLFDRESFNLFSLTFVGIILEAFPFMLVGALLSGAVETYVPPRFFIKLLEGKNRFLLLLLAGLLGIILPSCECAIIPLVRRLMRKGLPFSIALAYLLAGPIVNPLVILSTYYAYSFDWLMPLWRLGMGYGLAIFIAGVMDRIYPLKTALIKELQNDHAFIRVENKGPVFLNVVNQHKPSWWHRTLHFLKHARDEFFEVSLYLIVGAFIASFIQNFIGRQALSSFASEPVVAIIVMMFLAVISNICSETDAFVAATFNGAGVPLVGQLAFIVLGPMLDVKLFFMYFKILKKKAVLTLSAIILLSVFVSCVVASRWLV